MNFYYWLRFFLLSGTLTLSNVLYAEEAEDLSLLPKARLVLPPIKSSRESFIQKLELIESPVKLEKETVSEETRTFAIVTGRFFRPEWALFFNKRNRIQLQPGGLFEFKLLIQVELQPVEIMAVGPNGEIEIEKIAVEIERWSDLKQSEKSEPPKRLIFSTGLSYTYNKYQETRFTDLVQHSLTARANLNYLIFPPSWDTMFSTLFTALPLKTNKNASAFVVSIQGRLGYILPFVREPFRLSLLAGVYYQSIFTRGATFGYKHLIGPQFYPSFRYLFKKGQNLSAYLKYSPILNGVKPLGAESREIAAGIRFVYPLKSGNPVALTLDISDLFFQLGKIKVQDQTYSAGVGYGF